MKKDGPPHPLRLYLIKFMDIEAFVLARVPVLRHGPHGPQK